MEESLEQVREALQKELRNKVHESARRHEQLVSHHTMTASTLLGLMAVFGNWQTLEPVPLVLTAMSVLSLLAAVLVGLASNFVSMRQYQRLLGNAISQFQQGSLDPVAHGRSQVLLVLLEVFPWLLAAGILFLSAAVLSSLYIQSSVSNLF